MNRRQVLATGALAVAAPLAGCSDNSPSTLTPVGSAQDPPDGCGRADQPLSHRLTDDPGDSAPCPEAVTPSLAVENERSDPVAVDLDLDRVADSYTLAPGERTVAERAVELASPPAGSVTVDGERTETSEFRDVCGGLVVSIFGNRPVRIDVRRR